MVMAGNAPGGVATTQLPKITRLVRNTIVFVFLMLCIEETFAGWLNLSGTPLVLFKLLSEVILAGVLSVVLAHRILTTRDNSLVVPSILISLILFMLLALYGTLWNGGSLFSGIVTIRTGFRYVLVFLIITLSRWTPDEADIGWIYRVILWMLVVQSLLTILQFVLGDGFRDAYFSPPAAELTVGDLSVETAGLVEKNLGAGIGTLGLPGALAFALLAGFVLVMSRIFLALSDRSSPAAIDIALAVLFIVGMGLTLKRGPVLMAMMVPFVMMYLYGMARSLLLMFVLILVFSTLLTIDLTAFAPQRLVSGKDEQLAFYERLTQLLSPEYWERNFTYSRGWMITQVGGTALFEGGPFGFGADMKNAQEILASMDPQFSRLVGWPPFKDVYIVAALVFFGPIGMAILVLFFGGVFARSRRNMRHWPVSLLFIPVAVQCLILLLIPLLFLERGLELRVFSYILWTSMAIVSLSVILPVDSGATSETRRREADGAG